MATWLNHVVIASSNPPAPSGFFYSFVIGENGSLTSVGRGGSSLPFSIIAGNTFAPTVGNLLVAIAYSFNYQTNSEGWTDRYDEKSYSYSGTQYLGPAIFSKTVAGNISDKFSFSPLQNTGSNSNTSFVVEFFEFYAGSQFVPGEVATNVAAGGSYTSTPNGTAITTTAKSHVFSVLGQPYTSANGSVASSTTWAQGTTLVDYTSNDLTSNGYHFSTSVVPDYPPSKFNGTVSYSGTSSGAQVGVFGITIISYFSAPVVVTARVIASGSVGVSSSTSTSLQATISPVASVLLLNSFAVTYNATIFCAGLIRTSSSSSISVGANVAISSGLVSGVLQSTFAGIYPSGFVSNAASFISQFAVIYTSGVVNKFYSNLSIPPFQATILCSGKVTLKSSVNVNTLVNISKSGFVTRRASAATSTKVKIYAKGIVTKFSTASVNIRSAVWPIRAKIASSSGSFVFAGSSIGIRKANSSSSVLFNFSVVAAGYKLPKAVTTGLTKWTGSAVGSKSTTVTIPHAASTSVLFNFSGRAVGSKLNSARASTLFNFSGVATGKIPLISHTRSSFVFISENRTKATKILTTSYADNVLARSSFQLVSQNRTPVRLSTIMVSQVLQSPTVTTYQFISNNLPRAVVQEVSSISGGAKAFVMASSKKINQSLHPKAN